MNANTQTSLRTSFQFANHQQYAARSVKFSGFTKLSSSGDLDRYLACGDAELILTTPDMPVAKNTSGTERITIPVTNGSIVLVETVPESDRDPYDWFMVSVPCDAAVLVEDILDE
jgi:hypothetical protein